MLNEFAYCPRLCYIEWVQGEFLDSVDTVDGRFQHRRVDAGSGGPSQDFETFHARSVYLTGAGITCRIDLLEGDGGRVTPVDYKRGQAPDIPEGAYEPERVQLCAQGLVLKENGFACDQGVVYFVKSKKRVTIPFDDALVGRTKALISALRAAAESSEMPLPLQHSPKCNRCSLAGICLPDEVTLLREMQADDEMLVGAKEPDGDWGRNGDRDGAGIETEPVAETATESVTEIGTETVTGTVTGKNGPFVRGSNRVRRLLPSDDDAKPVYVVGRGNTVRKREERLEIWSQDGKVSEPKLREISMLSLYGGVEITTPAMVELMQRGVPVLHFTHGGWFQGICQGTTHKNVELRVRQFQCAADPERSLLLARKVVAGKIKNCRTLLRRNNPGVGADSLALLAKLAEKAQEALASESLLGIEGAAAECYFSQFGGMLKEGGKDFSFADRNRRPPKDPVNAVLSYLYGILVKDLFVTLLAVGFDPYLGFYHRPRYGRPALALDMMEEFRPLVADSVAINLFNNEELARGDFVKTRAGVSLSSSGKKAAVAGYERRMETEIVHPLFGYKASYRRVLEVQSRLLGRAISGEIEQYPPFLTR
jgi:CRISP-associated protein Cas1